MWLFASGFAGARPTGLRAYVQTDMFLEAKVRCMTFSGQCGKRDPAYAWRKEVVMKLRRTKYKRTTPKSLTEYSSTSISLGDGFKLLVQTVVKIIEKYFGLLYVSTY